MRTIRLDLEYDGSAYAGFGLQPRRPTIQGEIERALAETLGERVRVTAAGRTDAGVHAAAQVVSFRTGSGLGVDALVRALNARLPEDVQVLAAADVPPDFDARRSALRRHYRYTIWRGDRRNLWWRRYCHHVPGPLDLAAMRAAAASLVGRHDFAAFASGLGEDPGVRSTVRTVEQAEWIEDGLLLHFAIAADAFLRHMVRAIVGTLLWVGRGRLDPPAVAAILAGRDRRRAGPNAPACGLMLVGVDYRDSQVARGGPWTVVPQRREATLGRRPAAQTTGA